MNVSFDKNNDAVSGILKLEIVKADYADQLDKDLRSIRQKANVPGFRKYKQGPWKRARRPARRRCDSGAGGKEQPLPPHLAGGELRVPAAQAV